jgi:hypothetical protein
MRAVDPGVQPVQDRQRSRAADLTSGLGVDTASLALGLDQVEVSEEFERNSGALVFGQQGCVKFGSNVRATSETSFVGDGNQRFPIFVFDLGRISGVAVALDPSVDGGRPIGNF